jgi:twinkle protein
MSSQLERAAAALDELAARRKSQIIKPADFEEYMRAREVDRDNVKPASDYRDELIQRIDGKQEVFGAPTPWSWLTEHLRFRPGEVTGWTGFNGHMKSLVTGYVAVGLLDHEDKVCIASFEMKPAATLHRMVRQVLGVNKPTVQGVDAFYRFTHEKLYLYDQQGTVKPERVIGVIYYCAEQLGITHVFVDSLMKCVADEDDYNGQKRFIDQLCAAARDLNIHIHIVHHSRKRDNERTRPGKQDAKGSGSIVDQLDNFITVFKTPKEDKEKNEDLPDFMLYCDKQRHGEWEGQFCLWFDEASLQFRATRERKLMQWL